MKIKQVKNFYDPIKLTDLKIENNENDEELLQNIDFLRK